MTLTNNDLQAIGSLIDEKLDQKLDQKLKPIEKRLGKIETEVKKIKKDTTYIIDTLDKEIMHQAKRVDRIEHHLGITQVGD